MGWKGMAIGGYLGSLFGGPLGAILGACLGHQVEKHVAGEKKAAPRTTTFRTCSSRERSMIFCASAAAMLAKMAKADGRVTREEIAGVESAFARLGFRSGIRDYAVSVFRKAKDDAHSIFDYAREFAQAVDSVEIRELFYELLWDVACADGTVSPEELQILQRVPRDLRINSAWYAYFCTHRLRRTPDEMTRPNELANAYALLGATAADDDETLRRKYRELAKKNHPDALRAQGLPEEMIGKATERMSRINSAWSAVKTARGL